MDEHENNALEAIAGRLAAAAEALDQAVARLAASAEARDADLGAKVDRIVAAVDEGAALRQHLETRIAELERTNAELQASAADLAARAGRKTLSPAMTALLAKSGVETSTLDPATLDKALAGLSVEQRVAVKAEMARAGLIG
jgi:predicted  nucleic acid-binding Zn-ribbon protein